MHVGAHRHRGDGDSGGGCARLHVGTYLYHHAVGAGNYVAVPACKDRHGRGLNEVPANVIRAIDSCREALCGGFWKS
jgi:hypothetical protein